MNFPKRVQQAIVPERHYRIVREGKDIGWMYTCEEAGEHQGKQGFFVSVLSHFDGEKGGIDMGSEMFSSLDLAKTQEAWVSITASEKGGVRELAREIGASSRQVRRYLDEEGQADPNDKNYAVDKHQPVVRTKELYTLDVVQTGKSGVKNTKREVPPYYVPKAMGSMLPRLLPLGDVQGYVFCVWESGEQELYLRYLDVKGEKDVMLGGESVHAVVVEDRVALEGDPTEHYFSPEGKYLGCYTPASKTALLPTDAQTLARRWPEAKIERPRLLDTPPEQLDNK